MNIKSIKYYCNYCKKEINGDIYWEPCYECKELLIQSLQEQKIYNRFNLWGQIWFVPKEKFSNAILLGEGKYVAHHMKRLAKKAVTHSE